MRNRYLVTGYQLWILISLTRTDVFKCNRELKRIVEQQQIGTSNAELEDDLKLLRAIFKKR